jgi:dTMP kinase
MTAVAGRFITLEGIEAVGKSTNLHFVADRLRKAGKPVLVTREPGGVSIAEKIREILLHSDRGAIDAMTELLLMFAARSAHVHGLLTPELARGRWVVCDRFIDATYAYQGAGRGVPIEIIDRLRELVIGAFAPDLTLVLDAPLDVSHSRRGERKVADRFEREDDAFFCRVRDGYLARAAAEPERIRVIDASRSLTAVQADIATALEEFLRRDVARQ